MKRRVIYMDDATWESLRDHAARRAESISEHIRVAVTGGPATAMQEMTAEKRVAVDRAVATRIAGHDAFAEYRPAPKAVKPRKA